MVSCQLILYQIISYVREIPETGSHPRCQSGLRRIRKKNDDIWTWCYLDVRETLIKAKELLMKLETDKRLVAGTAYCGQNLRAGEILELIPSKKGC